MVTTADQREIDNFAALSDHWWDMRGPMAPLHAFTPIRIDYILANIERFWPKKARSAAPASRPLTGLRTLDIGCGGGDDCRLGDINAGHARAKPGHWFSKQTAAASNIKNAQTS